MVDEVNDGVNGIPRWRALILACLVFLFLGIWGVANSSPRQAESSRPFATALASTAFVGGGSENCEVKKYRFSSALSNCTIDC